MSDIHNAHSLLIMACSSNRNRTDSYLACPYKDPADRRALGCPSIGVGSRLITVQAPVTTELVCDAIRREGTTGDEGIGDGVRIKFVGAERATIRGVHGEREEE